MDIMESIYQRARSAPQRVAFPEATEEKILQAARTCAGQGICRPVLVGEPDAIRAAARQYDVALDGIETPLPRWRWPRSSPTTQRNTP